MAGYVDLDILLDEQAMVDLAISNMEARFPGWNPNEAHLEVAQFEELARMIVVAAQAAADVSEEIFRAFGQKLVDVPPIAGAPAGLMATVTATDDAGYTMEAGTIVAYRKTGDQLIAFRSTEDRTIEPGTVAVAVPFQAEEVGTGANEIPVATELEPITGLAWVTSIVTTTESSGGAEAETPREYLNRLHDELQLMAPRPIKPNDFAVLARRTPGVHRAVAIDGYDPGPPEAFDQERMVAVAAVSEDGTAVGAGILADLEADLEAMREINFVVNGMNPNYVEIDIVFTARALPGYDVAVLEAAAEQAVKDFIDPKRWAGGDLDPPEWRDEKVVRYLEVAEVINSVDGIDHITSTAGNFDLTINGARVDVLMAGQAPLPKPIGVAGGDSSVNGTVVAP